MTLSMNGRTMMPAFAASLMTSMLIFAFPHQAFSQAAPNDKWVTIVMAAEPEDLDGCQMGKDYTGRVVKQNVVETLVQSEPADFSLKPRLATSWARVDDLTWRFNLRRDVKFHDSTPFTAQAVKYSIERTLPHPSCADKRFLAGFKTEINVIDDNTIEMKTSTPEPILPLRLAGMGIVSPNTPKDKLSLAPIGTGPYVFDSWPAGQHIALRRNDAYWGKRPSVEGARYLWRPESSVRASMVKIGEADVAVEISQQDSIERETDPKRIRSKSFTSVNGSFFLRLDSSQPPLNDRRVRLAMNYAIDRAGFIGTSLPQETKLATQIVVPNIPGHNHNIDKKPYPYDPAKAKQLLAEARAAGVPVDKEILMITLPASFASAAELLEGYYTMFKQVGLNVKLLSLEYGEYSKWNLKPFPENRQVALTQTLHDNILGDPVFSIHRYTCTGVSAVFCDPEMDKRIQNAAKLEGDKRVREYEDIFRTIHEDIVADVVLYHMIAFTQVNNRIKYVPDLTISSQVRLEDIQFQ